LDSSPHAVAFAQNTRDEVRLISGDGQITGALAAEPGMKQQTYVFEPGNLARRCGSEPNETTAPTLGAAKTGDTFPHVASQMQVRRLTPTECLRLQGMPDGWTKIPWRGKPAESCPDGPQYKAIGNSMAVPVMRWIGERIDKVEGILNGDE
jgi:DNA (cytosine-5)-methyltransferase 1